MHRSPFLPSFDQLPPTLPVFPLEGTIVLPQADLPLNIFEPRYLNMVEDALKTQHMFGMVQPDPSRDGSPPAIMPVGCAGRITSYSETADGRIVLSLTGLIRFHCEKELDTVRGYRVVVPDWSSYRADLDTDADQKISNRAGLMTALRHFFREKNLETEWSVADKFPDALLVNTMATLLPLEVMEKQALLEAGDVQERADVLRAAITISASGGNAMLAH